VFGRSYLLDTVWGETYVTGDRSVDNAVLRLRKKLGDLGEKSVGQRVTLIVLGSGNGLRDGRRQRIRVTLGERPAS